MTQEFVEWACGHTTVIEETHDSIECEIRRMGTYPTDPLVAFTVPPTLVRQSPSATSSPEKTASGSAANRKPRKAGGRSR